MVTTTYLLVVSLLGMVCVSNAQLTAESCPQNQYLRDTECVECPTGTGTLPRSGALSHAECFSRRDRQCLETERLSADNGECKVFIDRQAALGSNGKSPHRVCLEGALVARCRHNVSLVRCGLQAPVDYYFSDDASCEAFKDDVLSCYSERFGTYHEACDTEVSHNLLSSKIIDLESSIGDARKNVYCPYIQRFEDCTKTFFSTQCPDVAVAANNALEAISASEQCGDVPLNLGCGRGKFVDAAYECKPCPPNTHNPYFHINLCRVCPDDVEVEQGSTICTDENSSECLEIAIDQAQSTECYRYTEYHQHTNNDIIIKCLSEASLLKCQLVYTKTICPTSGSFESFQQNIINEQLDNACNSRYIDRDSLTSEPSVQCFEESLLEVKACSDARNMAVDQLDLTGTSMQEQLAATCPYDYIYGECVKQAMQGCYSSIGTYVDELLTNSTCGSPNVQPDLSVTCGMGKRLDFTEGQCVECPENTYNDLEHSLTCKSCPQGSISQPGLAQCTSIDECLLSTTTICAGPNQMCVETPQGSRCHCNEGYRDVGITGPDCKVQLEIQRRLCSECEEVGCGPLPNCTNSPVSFECSCQLGFRLQVVDGLDTCVDIDECEEVGCGPLPNCTNLPGSFDCSCQLGFKLQMVNGLDTCVAPDACLATPNPCTGANTRCETTTESFECFCLDGFMPQGNNPNSPSNQVSTDEDCIAPDACLATPNPCTGANTRCETTTESFECYCLDGYMPQGNNPNSPSNLVSTDEDCIAPDACLATPNPCTGANTRCETTTESFECYCLDGYMPQGNNPNSPSNLVSTDEDCIAPDACLATPNPCTGANTRCETTTESFECFCLDGYMPQGNNPNSPSNQVSTDEDCIAPDACLATPNPCTGVNTRCETTTESFECYCLDGYMPQGNNPNSPSNLVSTDEDCIAPDACLATPNPCTGANTRCETTTESFECFCLDGYMPQGNNPNSPSNQVSTDEDCIAPDACLATPNPCTGANTRCETTTESFECFCLDGFMPQGNNPNSPSNQVSTDEDCIDVDECANQSPCDLTKSTCNNAIGSYNCDCNNGYVKMSGVCEDVNECAGTLCDLTKFTCVNTIGSYTCNCNAGYVKDSGTCIDCSSTACGENEERYINNGQCDCKCSSGNVRYRDGSCSDCTDWACDVFSQESYMTDGECACRCKTGYVENSQGACIAAIIDCTTEPCESNEDGYTDDGQCMCRCKAGFIKANGTCTDCKMHSCEADKVGYLNVDQCECRCDDGFIENAVGLCVDCTGNQCGENRERYIMNDRECGCQCKDGFTMQNDGSCTDVDECANQSPCDLTKSTCNNAIGSYNCDCNNGYVKMSGVCEDVNECAGTLCDLTKFTCVNTIGSYTCNCNAGYVKDSGTCIDCSSTACGENEERYINNGQCDCKCSSGNVRYRDGSCSDCTDWACDVFSQESYMTDGECACRCKTGYDENSQGACIANIIDCTSDMCESNKVGYLNVDQCDCRCDDGFIENAVGLCVDCTGNQCGDNGESYIMNDGECGCQCKDGSTMQNDGSCTAPAACLATPNPCTGANTRCMTTTGSFECFCLDGYMPQGNNLNSPSNQVSTDEDCIDINECTSSDDHCNPTTQQCINSEGSFACTCRTGFIRNDIGICIDIDECTSDDVCETSKDCTNTDGSYSCACKSGYTQSPTGACIDNNECVSSPCSSGQPCINVPGTYLCQCAPGFHQLNGVCSDIDECMYMIDTCNRNTQRCENQQGTFRCDCADGYFSNFDDTVCIDVNECAEVPSRCGQNGNCVNTVGSFVCSCLTGFAATDPSSTQCDAIVQMDVKLKLLTEFSPSTNGQVNSAVDSTTRQVIGSLLQTITVSLSPGSVVVDMDLGVVSRQRATELLTEELKDGFFAGFQIDPKFTVISINGMPAACREGEELVTSGQCEKCKRAYYKPTLDLAACTWCGDEMTTLLSGAVSSTQCILECREGTFWMADANDPRGQCFVCPLNTYSSTRGQAACTPCGEFSRTENTGSTSPSDCSNVCESPEIYCLNNGTCLWDALLAKPNCMCQFGFGGPKCSEMVTIMTAMDPNFGPLAGGTSITVDGINFDIGPSATVQLGDYPCVVEDISPAQMRCRSRQVPGDQVRVPQNVTIRWNSQDFTLITNYIFTYLPDPIVEGINPKSSILGGGTTLTVTGLHFTSVKYPVLLITAEHMASNFRKTFEQPCDNVNSTLMLCQTPVINLTQTLLDLIPEVDPQVKVSRRRRRQATDMVNFFVGVRLDGQTAYMEFTPVNMYANPVLKPLSEILEHRPFWPFGDTSFDLSGESLNAVAVHEYTVRLGGGMCDQVELFDNKIVCFPPGSRPEGAESGNNLRLEVDVGVNIKFDLGMLHFENHLFEYQPALIGLIVGIVVIVLAVILTIVLCKICRGRYGRGPKYRDSPLTSRHHTYNTAPQGSHNFHTATRMHTRTHSFRSDYSSLTGSQREYHDGGSSSDKDYGP